VFAAVALELIPKVRAASPWIAIVGFIAGIGAMSALSAVTRALERRAHPGGPGIGGKPGLMAATGIDLMIDGLVLGAGFAAAERSGVLLTIALTLELVLVALSNAGALAQTGVHPVLRVLTILGLGLLKPRRCRSRCGRAWAGVPQHARHDARLGSVAWMYLVTEELLVEAHEVKHTYLATAVFFVGFLCYLVVAELMAPVA
jgi:ZIP family zinc transporter